MPFGFKTAPACFQRLMNELMGLYLYKGVIVYLEDIIAWADSLEDLSNL